MYNILSIDGGGVRNIITLRALMHMEEFACKYINNPANNITGVKCTD
jgi:patatin-like phospholipase/acyl hydrolase